MQAVLGLVLFSVLLAGASSLECEECNNNNGRTCTGKKVTCGENEVCLHIVTEVTSGGFRAEKKCEAKDACESLKKLKGKPGTGRYVGKIDDVECNKAPSTYVSLLLALSGFLLKNVLF